MKFLSVALDDHPSNMALVSSKMMGLSRFAIMYMIAFVVTYGANRNMWMVMMYPHGICDEGGGGVFHHDNYLV